MSEVLLDIQNLSKNFYVGKKILKAFYPLNLQIMRGETLGLVGESGSGKTTMGRTILYTLPPSSGRVLFDGIDLNCLNPGEMKKMRQRMQMIFQDPYASLNPRMTVQDIVREPLDIHHLLKKEERTERVEELLSLVGLTSDHMSRFPHEFSGGQRQRIGIARALAIEPEFIVCDEPISALDVSIQAQIVNLLNDLQKKMGLTYLFIAHDLAMVKYISTRVAVLYLGQLMELAPTNSLFEKPLHPYSQALISSIPIPDPIVERKRERILLAGEIPNPLDPPPGCPFSNRCPFATKECFAVTPPLREVKKNHYAACHLIS